MGGTDFDIELQLLLDAIYLKYHYDFRGYSTASLKRRLRAAMLRFDCQTLSQLQDKVLHDPAAFPALLDFLTVQVSDMFRDPSYFRSLRDKVVPLLRTYPSLKVWVAGCSTGEEVYSFAILLREEGLLERTLIYATDINPQTLQKAEAGVYELDRIAGFTENHRRSGARSSLSDYYTAAYGRAVFDKSLKKRDRLLRSQPRHRQRVRGGSAHLLPQRADLLRPRPAGPRDRPVPGLAVPQGVPRHRLEGIAALFLARRRFTELVREDRIFQKRDDR